MYLGRYWSPSYWAPSYFGTGSGGVVPPEPIPQSRDMKILMEIVRQLEASRQFDGVYPCSTPELSGRPTSDQFAVGVEIDSVQPLDLWDGGDGTGLQVSSTLRFTFLGRSGDPIRRDQGVDRLVNMAANVLNGQSILDVTVNDRTRFTSHKWLPATPPERRVVSLFSYSYLVDGWAGFDATD